MKKIVVDHNFYKNLRQIMCQRSYLAVLALLGCLALSIIYLMVDLKIYTSEPALKCILICLAVGVIGFCKIALGIHLTLLITAIFWKNIPKGYSLPSSKEMGFVSTLILLQVILFYLLDVYYEEDFYIAGIYLAIKYLIVVALITLHTKLTQLGYRKKE